VKIILAVSVFAFSAFEYFGLQQFSKTSQKLPGDDAKQRRTDKIQYPFSVA
jgi:hypothetical protein